MHPIASVEDAEEFHQFTAASCELSRRRSPLRLCSAEYWARAAGAGPRAVVADLAHAKPAHRGDHRLWCSARDRSGTAAVNVGQSVCGTLVRHRTGAPPRSRRQDLADRRGFAGGRQNVKRFIRKLPGGPAKEACAVTGTAVAAQLKSRTSTHKSPHSSLATVLPLSAQVLKFERFQEISPANPSVVCRNHPRSTKNQALTGVFPRGRRKERLEEGA
jgi:hypothetical protein